MSPLLACLYHILYVICRYGNCVWLACKRQTHRERERKRKEQRMIEKTALRCKAYKIWSVIIVVVALKRTKKHLLWFIWCARCLRIHICFFSTLSRLQIGFKCVWILYRVFTCFIIWFYSCYTVANTHTHILWLWLSMCLPLFIFYSTHLHFLNAWAFYYHFIVPKRL